MPKRKRSRSFRGSASAKKKARRGPLTGIVKKRRPIKNAVSMGFLGIERKFYDTSLTATNLTAPTDAAGGECDPASLALSTPAVGTAENQREGKQISCLYLDINFCFKHVVVEGAIDPPNAMAVYFAVVLDTQTNAAQLNSEDVFKNTGASANLATSPMKNLLFGKRFRLLKAHTFTLPCPPIASFAANDIAWGGQERLFRWFIPLKGMKVNFNAGTTASIANVIDNSLHVIAYVNTISPQITIQYNSRLRFVG